jgi:hypothetical protein
MGKKMGGASADAVVKGSRERERATALAGDEVKPTPTLPNPALSSVRAFGISVMHVFSTSLGIFPLLEPSRLCDKQINILSMPPMSVKAAYSRYHSDPSECTVFGMLSPMTAADSSKHKR